MAYVQIIKLIVRTVANVAKPVYRVQPVPLVLIAVLSQSRVVVEYIQIRRQIGRIIDVIAPNTLKVLSYSYSSCICSTG